MPPLIINPHELQCPDYGLQEFANARAPLLALNLTEAQVADTLRAIWTANNDRECIQWDQQIQTLQQEDEDRRRLAEEEQERKDQAAAREKEDLQRDERKKHKAKYLPIPDLPMPDQPAILPSPFALRQLERGDYVPLWYWTNAGLRDALKSFTSSDVDAMSVVQGRDGGASFMPTSQAKGSKQVINDEDLDFEDFVLATSRIVTAMSQSGWPDYRVRMMGEFWMRLQAHEFRSNHDSLGKKALLVFQAEQRQAWHRAMDTPGGGYNLARINEKLLRDTKETLFWKSRTLQAADSHVSFPFRTVNRPDH